ncbi:MAG: HD domain-containing protein [Planctomycetes bacterium]|nr:HD domain-containing protein [Planctomycetota bacterium]
MTPPRTTPQVQRAAIEMFAHALVAATTIRQLHATGTPWVDDALQGLIRALDDAAHAGVEMPLRLQISDHCLCHDGVPLDGPSLQAGALLQRCVEREIAALAFTPGLTIDEANRCFDLLLPEHNKRALTRRHRDQVLRAMGIRHVAITSRIPGDPSNRTGSVHGRGAMQSYQALADCLQRNHVRASHDQQLTVTEANGIVERTLVQLEKEPSSLLALAAQDNIDRFTVGHSVRVALLALQVARATGATHDQLVHVGTAALLHDIGKSKIPEEVLFKQGRLDKAEWACMAQHPRLGAQVLIEQPDLDASAIGAAFCHHMGPDGRGYPTPALPMRPSATSRLVRVCDVFEALTAVRPYKRALTPCEAYAVMLRNEADFDQRWLRRFIRTLGVFPQGTRLLLDDGAHALVTEQTDCPHRPIVQLLSGPGGAELPASTPTRLALGTAIDGVTRKVAAVTTHDRTVRLPELEVEDPQVLTQSPQHACVSLPIQDGARSP